VRRGKVGRLKPNSFARPASLLSLVACVGALGCRDPSPAPGGPEAAASDVGDPFVAPAPGTRTPELRDAGPEAGAAATKPTATATVRMLDPGKAPRRKLRYAWHKDRRETLTIDLRTTAATESEGERPPEVPLPPVRIVVALEPRDVTPAGDLAYAWHVTSTKVTPAPGSNPQLAEGMVAEVGAIAHLTGTGALSARGLSTAVTVDPGSVADVSDAGATGEMVEQVRQTLFDLETPFPDEEVGPGARWEKIARLTARSAVVTQTETFTLASLAADRGTVDDVLAQTAPPQEWPGGGGWSEPSRLDSMLATGTVRSRFDLTRIVPATTYAGTTTMVVSGRAGSDAPRRVTMILRVDITLAGSTP
jgi:hypothetical protein